MGKLLKHGNRRAEAAALRASFEPIQRRMDAADTWNSRGRSNGYAVQPSDSACARALAALQPGLGLASKKAAEEAVKALQRADPAGNALWWAFCDRYGGGARDPCRHKLSFLHKFLVDFTNAALHPSGIENDFEASQTQSLARQRIFHSGASQTCPELPEIIEEAADFFNKPSIVEDLPELSWRNAAPLPGSLPPGLTHGTLGARSADEAESLLNAINRAGLGDSLRSLQACAGDSPESICEMRRAMLHEVTMKLQSMIGKEAMDSLETRPQIPVKEAPQDAWHVEEQAPWRRMMPQVTYPQRVMTVPELSVIEKEQYHRAMFRTCPGSLPSLEGIHSSASNSAAPESFAPVGGRGLADFFAQPLRVDTSQLQELSAIEKEQCHRANFRTCPGSLPSLEGIHSPASNSAASESFAPVGGRGLADSFAQPLRVDTSQLQEGGVGSFISASPKVRPSLREKKISEREPCLGQALMTHGQPSHVHIRPDYLRSSGRIGEARTCPELPLVFEEEPLALGSWIIPPNPVAQVSSEGETEQEEIATHSQIGCAQTLRDLTPLASTVASMQDLPPLPKESAQDVKSYRRIGEARTCPELPLVFEDSSVVMRMCL